MRTAMVMTGLVLFIAGCGTRTTNSCNVASCGGCCDAVGLCQLGTQPGACGKSGESCSSCALDQSCFLGECRAIDGGTGSTDSGMNPCETGQLCNHQCVDTQNDAEHCGACQRACGETKRCAAGQCVDADFDCRLPGKTCAARTFCDATTGLCTAGCTTSAQCQANATCDLTTRQCTCIFGTHACGSVCADDTSTGTCGDRCTECPAAPANAAVNCLSNACGFVCNPGFHQCNGTCVSNASTDSCGASCAPCSSDPLGTATCDGTRCGIDCDSSSRFCGAACATCPTDHVAFTTCDGSRCVAQGCTIGARFCAGTCSECPVTNVASTACNGDTCVATTCSTGARLCDGVCAACPSSNVMTTMCMGTSCVATMCNPGFKVCGTGCCVKWSEVSLTDTDASTRGRIAFTSTGDVWLAYTASNLVRLKRWSGGSTFTTLANPLTDVALVAVAVKNDVPAIAWVQRVSPFGQRLMFSEWNGTTWSTVTVTDGVAGTAAASLSWSSIEVLINPGGEPVIVSTSAPGGTSSGTVNVATRSNGVFTTEIFANGLALSSSAVLIGNELHVAWTKNTGSMLQNHARKTSGVWASSPIRMFSGSSPIAIAGDGNELVFLSATEGTFVFTRWNGTSYVTDPSDYDIVCNSDCAGFSYGQTAIAMGGLFTHTAYPVWNQNERATRHRWRAGTSTTYQERLTARYPGNVDFKIGPGGDGVALVTPLEVPSDGGVAWPVFVYER